MTMLDPMSLLLVTYGLPTVVLRWWLFPTMPTWPGVTVLFLALWLLIWWRHPEVRA